jgi:glycosyltransferase involved in cell wall biosynthesis
MIQSFVNCAIDYFPNSFATSGKSLMGLQAANEGFLKAFLRYGDLPACIAHVRNNQEASAFAALVAEVCGEEQSVAHLTPNDQAGLARVGALLHPFPGFGPLAWNRQFAGPASYSLLGITHTTAAQSVMDSIGNLAVAPIRPWDAVICTSRAVRATYETVLELWEDYLRDRLGAQRLPRPQLPIIPLGVDTRLITPATQDSKQRWRKRLSIPDEAFVVLWVGRFNHAAKTHPIPTYLALEQVAQQLDQPVVYLQAGWFPNDATRDGFINAAQRWAPTVKHLFVNGRDPEVRREIWHAADVFCSLSDNIQETFGLTPIEAMAAGLPVVVSDWNGYRDRVRNGIDGFLIPTAMPASGTGPDLAQGYCAQTISDGHYWAVTAQTIAVDLHATIHALTSLAQNPGLRLQQSQACRRHVESKYEWEVVIAQVVNLLHELSERRASAVESNPALGCPPTQPAPLRGDPYQIFAGYPSATIQAATTLELSRPWLVMPASDQEEQLHALREDCLHAFANGWRLNHQETIELLSLIAHCHGITVGDAAQELKLAPGQPRHRLVMSTVSWLLKLGILHATHPSSG